MEKRPLMGIPVTLIQLENSIIVFLYCNDSIEIYIKGGTPLFSKCILVYFTEVYVKCQDTFP